jgi:hypothetical protein
MAERIEALAALGRPWEEIADFAGVTVSELRECYGDELLHGPERVRQRLKSALYRKAVSGNVAATKLWWKRHGQEGA